MQTQKKRLLIAATVAGIATLALLAGAAAFVRAGLYDVGADDPHHPATYALLEQLREASIRSRARALVVPGDLMTPARITQGAGNYDAMCTQCHLAPGMGATELSRGLYPAPPDLTKHAVDAAEAFWVIKHGIKATGMPAWGHSMDDAYIWNMAAFLQRLPTLDAAAYRALVDASGGHSHGGGESMPQGAADHPHPAGTGAHPHPKPDPEAADSHAHAPGAAAHPHPPAKATAHVDAPGAPPHAH